MIHHNWYFKEILFQLCFYNNEKTSATLFLQSLQIKSFPKNYFFNIYWILHTYFDLNKNIW